MTITADLLRTWSERICTLPATDARELVSALELGGAIVPRPDALVVEPPPPGAAELRAVEREGRFDRLELRLSGAGVTRAELERSFGRGAAPLHNRPIDSRGEPGGQRPPGVRYRLDLPDAPFGCDVSAEFAPAPADAAPAPADAAPAPADAAPIREISLRRQPPRPAEAPRPSPTLAELVDVLAQVTERLRREDGPELVRHVEGIRDQVAHLGQTMQAAAADEQARKAAAAQIEQLVDAVGQTGAAAGRAIARQGPAVRQAIGALDLGALTDALRRFAELLASGTAESQARMKELLAQLEATAGASMGKMFATNAERQKREDEERRAAIKRDVQASLDEIFRGKKKP